MLGKNLCLFFTQPIVYHGLSLVFILFLFILMFYLGLRLKIKGSKTREELSSEYARQIIAIQEDERRTFARELHDTIAQDILVVKMGTESLKKQVAKETTVFNKDFDILIEQEASAINQIRTLCSNLRPSELEHLGLKAALATLCSSFEKKSGIRCQYLVSGFDSVDKDKEIHCYRIVQEALQNIRKHARANQALVQLTGIKNSKLSLLIEDDGVGLSTKFNEKIDILKFGLIGIQERVKVLNGTFSFNQSKLGGSSLFIIIPLTDDSNESKM